MLNFKNLPDAQLIERIKNFNCSDSIVELTSRHQGLVVQVAKKYAYSSQTTGVALEDFLQDSMTLVFDAARDFNEEKNVKFSTWLGSKVRYFCLNTLTRESKYYSAETTDVADHLINSVSNEAEVTNQGIQDEAEYVLNILEQIKDERIKKVVRMRYFEQDKTRRSFGVIAQELNMSKQGVIDLHDNFINFIRQKIRSRENMDEI